MWRDQQYDVGRECFLAFILFNVHKLFEVIFPQTVQVSNAGIITEKID
jgi:hypothetical protein